MDVVDGFQITRGAVQVQDGYLPMIEAQGLSADGRTLRGRCP
ncbi:hypothetical protein WJ972_10055 [Achromobacter insuavis]